MNKGFSKAKTKLNARVPFERDIEEAKAHALVAIAEQLEISNRLKAIELVEGDLGMHEAYMKRVLEGKSGL